MDNVRLLLADKNLSYLEIARKMLRFHDDAYQVDVATSGEECLEKLHKNYYDLLLLDYDIDGKKGLEILLASSILSEMCQLSCWLTMVGKI